MKINTASKLFLSAIAMASTAYAALDHVAEPFHVNVNTRNRRTESLSHSTEIDMIDGNFDVRTYRSGGLELHRQEATKSKLRGTVNGTTTAGLYNGVIQFQQSDKTMKFQSFVRTIIDSDNAANKPAVRIVLLETSEQLKGFGLEAFQKLLEDFEDGTVIIGRQAKSKVSLDAALGLAVVQEGPGDNQNSTGGAANDWVFLHRHHDGSIDQLNLVVDTVDSLPTAFELICDWYLRNSDQAADDEERKLSFESQGPWNAIRRFEWTGVTMGDFEGKKETAGTYRLNALFFYLDSDKDGRDWYRVDFKTISAMNNYRREAHVTYGSCGWWTDKMHATMNLEGDGKWFEYMPSTSISSRTQGFTIGGGLSNTGGGISAGYSASYGTEDVEIVLQSDTIEQSLHWKADLLGCHNYAKFWDYDGASKAARSTFELNPSGIAHVPKGSNLEVSTQFWGNGEHQTWGLNVEKNLIRYPGWDTHRGAVNYYPNFYCNRNGCRSSYD